MRWRARAARPWRSAAAGGVAVALLASGGCAYFNTLHNANLKYREAIEMKKKADPDRLQITGQEKRLYEEAFEKAAKVVKYYPDSRWVDDALLLMARASHERGDYSTALRKYDEILTFFPDSELVPETLVMQARTAVEIRDYDLANEAVRRAQEFHRKGLRDDITYLLGVVAEARGNVEGALTAYADVLEHHGGSEWFGQAGMRAGALADSAGEHHVAASYYDRVRKDGHTPRERYDGGMKKGEALLATGEWKRAHDTFRDVGDRTANDELRSEAYLMQARAVDESGDAERAARLYEEVIERFPRTEAAGEAQFEIAARWDREGDLETAYEQYELVKDQGTGLDAWQRAAKRQLEIQRVLDLRKEIASDEEEEPERKRFLLAEQLLEKIGDVDAALAEYASLAADAEGTEWGSRALFAEAWVLENRRDDPDSANTLLFRLANQDTRTDVAAAARRRHGMPVWRFERVTPPKVVFIRPEGEEEPEQIVLSRVEPRDVPLPPGVRQVDVWVRVSVGRDGSVKSAKIVKSGGDEFDAASLEAARASRFLAPDDGGPEISVVQYRFPPGREDEPAESAESALPPPDDEPSAAERDAMLDRLDAEAAESPADSTAMFSPPPPEASTPGGEVTPPGGAPVDSVDAFRRDRGEPVPGLRDRRFPRGGDD